MEKQWKIHLRLQDRIGESIGEGDKDRGIIGEGGDKCICGDSNGDDNNDGVNDNNDDDECKEVDDDGDDDGSCRVYIQKLFKIIWFNHPSTNTWIILTGLVLRDFFNGDPTW